MKTLLFGNTRYVTKEFIQETFPKETVYILGETHLKSSKKLKLIVFPKTETFFLAEILRMYQFDQILYFSNFLTYKTLYVGELERLQTFLSYTKEISHSKLLYVTGPKLLNHPQELEKAAEDICLNWTKENGTSLKIVHSPYIYSSKLPEDYFYQLFDNLHQNEVIHISEPPNEIANFINTEDLAELIGKIFDSWDNQTEILNIYNPFHITFQHLIAKMKEVSLSKSKLEIDRKEKEACCYLLADADNLRKRYGWFIHYSVLDDLSDLYEDFMKAGKTPERLEFKRLRKAIYILHSHKAFQKTVEIALAFLFSEMISILLNRFNQFKMLDVRLVFVTLVSTILGTSYGLFAGLLSIVGLFVETILLGGNWQAIVYNTDRWLSFSAYLVVALICGMVQMNYQDEKEMLDKENEVLHEKNELLAISYEDVACDRETLIQQVASGQNGVSKLFFIFQQLDKPTVEAILNETKKVVEDQLKTDQVRLYSLASSSDFDVHNYPELAKTLAHDEIWINKNLLPDYPFYVLEIKSASGLDYLLWIEDVSYSHLSLSQVHFLKMIGGITASMLDKASYHQVCAQFKKEGMVKNALNTMKDGD